MTLARLLPFHIHAALEAAIAPAIIVAPLLFGFPPAAIVGAVVIGALMMGSAIHGSSRSPRVSAHLGSDVLVASLAAGLAIAMAVAGELAAAGFFALAAFTQAFLAASTSYSGATR